LVVLGFFGFVASVIFYLVLFFVQIANAHNACEDYHYLGAVADPRDVRGEAGFEDSYLNLGGRCTWYMNDGSVVVTREPGWSFSGTTAGFVALLAVVSFLIARRKGYPGWLCGLTTFWHRRWDLHCPSARRAERPR
jgi:hypothetical protein